MDVTNDSALMRLLGDDVRLRLLRALSVEALNVSELTAVLGIAQSGVSRHLGMLRKASLVVEERAGGYAWYRLSPDARDPGSADAELWSWLRAAFGHTTPATKADDARLQEVLRLRKERFAEHGADGERGQLVPGRSWVAWSRALAFLLPPLDVADLGCGEGYLTIETARWARRVVAIDRSATVLAHARALAGRRKVQNITWKRGELERLPLADASVDVALLSQALHHAKEPAAALGEARRVLRPGGRVLILDLREHGESWVRARLGDEWPGFADKQLRDLLVEAGFDEVKLRVGARSAGDPFVVLVAAATKTSSRPAARPRRVA